MKLAQDLVWNQLRISVAVAISGFTNMSQQYAHKGEAGLLKYQQILSHYSESVQLQWEKQKRSIEIIKKLTQTHGSGLENLDIYTLPGMTELVSYEDWLKSQIDSDVNAAGKKDEHMSERKIRRLLRKIGL